MGFDTDFSYSTEVDLNDGYQGRVAMVYYELDSLANVYAMSSVGNFLKYQENKQISTTSASNNGVGDWISSFKNGDTSLYYSFILHPATTGSQNIGLTSNGYTNIYIDGVLSSISTFVGIRDNSWGGRNFEDKPYFFEVYTDPSPPNAVMDIGFGTTSPTPFDASSRIYSPATFKSSFSTSFPGPSRYYSPSDKSTICFSVILVVTLLATLVGIASCIFLEEKSVAVYSMIYYIQILLLTPLLGYSMHSHLLEMYTLLDVYFFHFNFLGQGFVFFGKC